MSSAELPYCPSATLRWSRAAAVVAAFAALTLGATPEVLESAGTEALLCDDDDDDDVRRARAAREGHARPAACRGAAAETSKRPAERELATVAHARPAMPALVTSGTAVRRAQEHAAAPSPWPRAELGLPGVDRAAPAPVALVPLPGLGPRPRSVLPPSASPEVPPRAGPDPPAAALPAPAIPLAHASRAMASAHEAAARPHRCGEDRHEECTRRHVARATRVPRERTTSVDAPSEVP
ncbi:MAG: hypothetical protein U0234_09875 [Sandaracinus sp.]